MKTTMQATARPMTQEEAGRILNAAIHRKMDAEKITYDAAFTRLQQEQPGLIQGYQAVVRRNLTNKTR